MAINVENEKDVKEAVDEGIDKVQPASEAEKDGTELGPNLESSDLESPEDDKAIDADGKTSGERLQELMESKAVAPEDNKRELMQKIYDQNMEKVREGLESNVMMHNDLAAKKEFMANVLSANMYGKQLATDEKPYMVPELREAENGTISLALEEYKPSKEVASIEIGTTKDFTTNVAMHTQDSTEKSVEESLDKVDKYVDAKYSGKNDVTNNGAAKNNDLFSNDARVGLDKEQVLRSLGVTSDKNVSKDIMKGAMKGAAVGSVMMPGTGTALGAAVGATKQAVENVVTNMPVHGAALGAAVGAAVGATKQAVENVVTNMPGHAVVMGAVGATKQAVENVARTGTTVNMVESRQLRDMVELRQSRNENIVDNVLRADAKSSHQDRVAQAEALSSSVASDDKSNEAQLC